MSAGPLRAVLAELEAGTATVTQIATNCGLSESMTKAALDHLVRSGRVAAKELSVGCPPSGCGGCALATGGCGQPKASSGRGLVTLSLMRKPAESKRH